jgi:hypothetical protein
VLELAPTRRRRIMLEKFDEYLIRKIASFFWSNNKNQNGSNQKKFIGEFFC